jgi:hypothetical protein
MYLKDNTMNKKALLVIFALLWIVACTPTTQNAAQTEAVVVRSANLEKPVASDTQTNATPNTTLPTPQIEALQGESAEAIEADFRPVAEEEIVEDKMIERDDNSISSTRPETEKGEDDGVTVGEPVQPVTVDLSNLSENSNRDEDEGSAPQVMPMPGVPDPTVRLVHNIRQDLAQKLSIDISQTTWVETKAVEWGDSSLGCPQPDMAYAAVITPGYRIIIRANGVEYLYHTNLSDTFILCQP